MERVDSHAGSRVRERRALQRPVQPSASIGARREVVTVCPEKPWCGCVPQSFSMAVPWYQTALAGQVWPCLFGMGTG
jgi:hypothetical protein